MLTCTPTRRHILGAVLGRADATGDVRAPWRAVPEAAEHFTSDAEVLLALQSEWVRVLVARLHRGEIVASRSEDGVRAIYREVAETHPVLRAVLDAHREDPALWQAAQREYAMLAQIAEVAEPEDDLDEVASTGRALVEALPRQRCAL